MTAPLVSCIVPVFNGERFLSDAVDSILAQVHRPIEIIVVDDGSTDGTPGVIAGYGDRVRGLRQANTGPAAARNAGVGSARGEFVAFLDADDRWHPQKLARQLARFAERPELDVSITLGEYFIAAGSLPVGQRHERVQEAFPAYASSAMLARRTVFERLGGFEAALAHADQTEWFLRARRHGAVVELLEEVLFYRRLHDESRSRRYIDHSHDEYLHLLKAHLDRRRAGQKGEDE